MSTFAAVKAVFALWIETVARTVDAGLSRIEARRRVQVIENEDGSYTAEETRKFPATTKSVA